MTPGLAPGPGETLDDLGNGLFVLQYTDGFRFGTDAVLLARFAALRPRERVADLGTGCGILPLLLIDKAPGTRFAALEIQPRMYDLARRSIALNGLEERIAAYNMDLRGAARALGYGAFDAVLSNPPYDKPDAAWPIDNESRRIARYEVQCTLDDVAASAAQLLKNGGRFYMIHRAARCLEVLDALRAARMEPKTLQYVHAAAHRPANFILTESVKLANPGMTILPPVFVGG